MAKVQPLAPLVRMTLELAPDLKIKVEGQRIVVVTGEGELACTAGQFADLLRRILELAEE